MSDQRRSHVVFVHGAWHDPSCWDETRAAMDGIATSAVALPSVGSDPETLAGMYDDAEVIRAHVLRVREADPSVQITVVAHSYGGVPTTEGLCGNGGEPPAARIVYLTAFVLDNGQSLLSAAHGTPPPFWQIDTEGGFIDPGDPIPIFYSDLPADVAERWARRLRHQSWASVTQPLTGVAYDEVPTTYVVCDADQGIPPELQEAMATHAAQVLHFDASHSAMLSRPRDLATLLTELVAPASE